MRKIVLLWPIIILFIAACTHPLVNNPDITPSTVINNITSLNGLWTSNPLGDRGRAQILIKSTADNEISFQLYIYQYTQFDKYSQEKTMRLNSLIGVAKTEDNLNYTFTLDKNIYINGIVNISGNITLDNDILKVSYNEAKFDEIYTDANLRKDNGAISVEYSNDGIVIDLPTEFTKVPINEIEAVINKRPLFEDEITLPFSEKLTPEEADRIFGKPLNVTMANFTDRYMLMERIYTNTKLCLIICPEGKTDDYLWNNYVQSVSTTNPKLCPNVRGIKIGDTIESVVSKFLCVHDFSSVKPQPLIETGDKSQLVLYGLPYNDHNNGRIEYENDKPTVVMYITGLKWIRFYLDINGKVEKVTYIISK